ncbi:uncharacterized protein [Rutidosis leptorrhynchoides]|uniref:uncharacterized protein isoform X1 n=1 Tax=Rutidosis leptorrhynchoides TaxID=125765 RepID=UPI003A9A229E
MDGNLETRPLELDFINDIDSCANLESHEQVDPLTWEEATIYNENLSSGLKDPENFSMWGYLNIMSESKTRSGTKLGKFKPKPNAQTRKVQQISNAPLENETIPSFQPTDESLGPTDTISEFHAIEDSTNLNEAAGRSSKS